MYANYSLNQIEERYIVYNKTDRNHYEVGYVDYKILQYFQEGKSENYICEQLSIGHDEYIKNKLQLFETGFLCETLSKKKSVYKWNKIYLLRIDTSKLELSKFTILLECILTLVSIVSAISLFIFILNNRLNLESIFLFDNASLLNTAFLFAIIQILTVLIHEVFHLVFAINRGANVPEVGVMLYFLSPSGFSDLTQINFFKNRGSKIICLLAGLLFNFSLLVFSLFMFYFFDLVIFQLLFIANLVAILINLGFYIKLDGYYILQILIDENYLREKSLSMFKKSIARNFTVDDLVYYIVGLCSIAYIPILLINISISLWRYFV